MKAKHQFVKSAAILAVFGLGTAFGQTASSAPATSTPAAKEEVVELSPFVVNAEEDTGYQAANTLGGSRMNTSLKDTAASISVMTEEFLKDIGALNLDEAVNFGNNIELDYTNANNDNGTNEFFTTYRIRGQAATVARNYFRWKLPASTFNVERIEEARGPNSILFGIASSGGMVSSQTKQANTNRNIRRAQLVYGSYDLRQVSVDVNQHSDNKKLAVRFNGLMYKTQGYQHYEGDEDNRAHLGVKYNLTPNTIVRAEYEHGKTFKTTPMSQEVGDNVMKWINAGRPLATFVAGKPVANTASGITLQGNAGNQSVVYIENDGVFRDWRQMAITQAASSALITDPALVDNVNFTINIAGPGQTQATNFDTYSAFIQQKLGKNTFLELAFNHQEYEFEAWQSFRITGLQGDPNPFLKDGVTPNPHAGQLFFDNEWEQRLRNEEFDNFRLTASTEFDFGKWGFYRMAGLAERENSFAEKRNYTDIWANASGFGGAFNTLAVSSANTVRHRYYITEGDYSTYHGSTMTPGDTGYFTGVANPLVPGQLISARGSQQGSGDFSDPSEQTSYLAAVQAFFLKRKLVLAGGLRKDTLNLHEGVRGARDPATNDFIVDNVNNPRTDRSFSGNTKTYGAVYHVLPWLSLRYNKSDSFELPNVGVRLTPRPDANGNFIGSRVGDNPQGVGEDYGFDLDLLDGKIFLRATKFSTTRAGAQQFQAPNNPTGISNRVLDALQAQGVISAAERALHKIDSGGAETDTASTGYEYSLTTNVTKDWRLALNYSITNSVTSNYGPEIAVWAATEIPYIESFNQALIATGGKTIAQEVADWKAADVIAHSVEGQATVGNRREKFSVVTRYSFANGFLKGLSIGGTARYQSPNVIGIKTTGEWVYGNSFTRADAFLAYRFGRSGRLPDFIKNLSLQLNVYNVLDQHDPLIMNVANINAATLAINRLRPQDPRYWRLTADFAF